MARSTTSSWQLDQHLHGQAWHIESIGPEHTERDTRWRHITTAWTVYIHDRQRHIYEVTQWAGGAVYRTHTVTLGPAGTLTCTCPAGRRQFARSVRGYCLHINRLMLHALRRAPTLPAPAAEWATLPIATGARAAGTGARKTRLAVDGDERPPAGAGAMPAGACRAPRFTPQTTTVMWMP